MKATIAIVFLIAFAMGALGPGEAMNRPAVKTTEQARVNAATEAMCGSENAAWQEVSPGVFQCFTHRGAKTKRSTP